MPLSLPERDLPESPEVRALAEALGGIRFAPRSSLGAEIVARLRHEPAPEPRSGSGQGALVGLLLAGLGLGALLFAFWRLMLALPR